MTKLIARGTQPALTWYDDGERIELSGKVMAMHISKIFYYLRDELSADESTTLVLDLPAHWKTTLWALTSKFLGCQVITNPDMTSLTEELSWSDIVVTTSPRTHPHCATEVALTMAPLALSWPGDLPDECEDGIAGPLGYPDVLAMADLPEVDLDVCMPPADSTPALAVIAENQEELTGQCAGALCTGHSLVICSPHSNIVGLTTTEHATIWGRITKTSKTV